MPIRSSANVCIGYEAGFFETGSNRLYIANTNRTSPLIYGEFDNELIGINGKLGIGTQSPSIQLHVDGGSDANLSSGGYIVTNSPSSSNIVIDDNEIMARNNGAASPLYMQSEGGDFSVHLALPKINEFIVKADGKTGIGENIPSDKLHVNSDTGEDAFRVQVEGATKFRVYANGGVSVGYNTAPTYALQLQNNSNQLLGKAVATSWNTYSDNRLKSNQKAIKYGLAEILKLSPKSYLHHNSSYSEDERFQFRGIGAKEDLGFIAQEVEKIIPEIVYQPVNENEELWSMDYTRLIPVLVKAIQDLDGIILSLETRIMALEKE